MTFSEVVQGSPISVGEDELGEEGNVGCVVPAPHPNGRPQEHSFQLIAISALRKRPKDEVE